MFTPTHLHRILTLGEFTPTAEPSAITRALSERLARVGVVERAIVAQSSSLTSHPHTAASLSDREVFLGDPLDPVTYALGAEDVRGAILDLTRAPLALWCEGAHQADHEAGERAGRGARLLEGATPLMSFQGAQKNLWRALVWMFGERSAPHEPQRRHSLWRETEARDQHQAVTREVTPLREALSLSPQLKPKRARPLTLLVSSTQLEMLRADLFCEAAIAEYKAAAWSPRVVCFDWTLSDLSASRSGQALSDMSEITAFTRYMICELIQLKLNEPRALERLEVARAMPTQSLALIGLQDLISATLWVHQRGAEGVIYRARGDRLTWGSFVQMCAYLVDEIGGGSGDEGALRGALARIQKRDDAPSLNLSARLNSWLKSSTQGSAQGSIKRSMRRSAHSGSTTSSVTIKLARAAMLTRGGPPPTALEPSLEALPEHFNWIPAHTLLEDELRRLSCPSSTSLTSAGAKRG